MDDWEAVIFLKTKCLPTHHQQAISNLRSASTIFSLLDTQYGSKNVELGKIKRKIIGDAPIANTLTFNMTQRLERVKVILKYLTIFIQHFKYVKDLCINKVSRSLMTWILESSYEW